jgi:hypothetical protein
VQGRCNTKIKTRINYGHCCTINDRPTELETFQCCSTQIQVSLIWISGFNPCVTDGYANRDLGGGGAGGYVSQQERCPRHFHEGDQRRMNLQVSHSIGAAQAAQAVQCHTQHAEEEGKAVPVHC